ncbi:glycoside hydrolase family 18 protein [Puteibacter caeruleilacunae]|nr:glycoside hydrolase family 18 protein [Puteibacter caeruleilacunae]
MAYYVAPGKDYHPDQLPLDKLSHIIYSFTEVIDDQMKFKNPKEHDKLQLLVDQKANHPNLKVMIACGGWGGSGGFSDMASSDSTRQLFVNSAINFIQEHNLDGLDIDWEYPGLRGAGNPHKPEDKQNFTALMKELREAMDATGKKLTLTFASAGWDRYYDHVELHEVLKYADYMNVMTYDQVSGTSPVTLHHTNLGWVKWDDVKDTPAGKKMEQYGMKRDPGSAEKIIDYCLKKGVDPKQLVIGAAFYGRAWKGVPPENNGLYQPNKGVWSGWAAYNIIRDKYEGKNGFNRHWDPIAKAPFLYNPADSIFISYDDTMSVRLKTKFTKDLNLGGIMFWQLRLDTANDGLLDAIYRESKK